MRKMWRRGAWGRGGTGGGPGAGAGGGAGGGTGRGTANTNIRLIWCLHKESESYSGACMMEVQVFLLLQSLSVK